MRQYDAGGRRALFDAGVGLQPLTYELEHRRPVRVAVGVCPRDHDGGARQRNHGRVVALLRYGAQLHVRPFGFGVGFEHEGKGCDVGHGLSVPPRSDVVTPGDVACGSVHPMHNVATIVGHLGTTPEVTYTRGGKATCKLRIATTDGYTDADGNRHERTDWHRVVVWGKTAEACARHLEVGRQVLVTGPLRSSEWTTETGERRWGYEIHAERVVFLGKGDRPGEKKPGNAREKLTPAEQAAFGGPDADDIPF